MRRKTIDDHSCNCAHYGDSCAPCTCGAEPDIVGVNAARRLSWTYMSFDMTILPIDREIPELGIPASRATWRVWYDWAMFPAGNAP